MKRVVIDESNIENLEDLFYEKFLDGKAKGFLPLPCPVMNITEWKSPAQDHLSAVLGKTQEELEKIIYGAAFVVTKSSSDKFEAGQAITSRDIYEVSKDGVVSSTPKRNDLEYLTGAEAVKFLLERLDLEAMFNEEFRKEKAFMAKLQPHYDKLDDDSQWNAEDYIANADDDDVALDENCPIEPVDALKYSYYREYIDPIRRELDHCRRKMDALNYYKNGGAKRLFIDELVMFPLELRSLLQNAIKELPYAGYGLVNLYRRVYSRSSRTAKLIDLGAPEIILINEKRMLQEAVDALIANGMRGKPVSANTQSEGYHPLLSLTDLLRISLKVS